VKLPGRALFVGAHCDDIELFAGALLHRLCRTGAERVGVIVFSDHRGVMSQAMADRARAEMLDNLAFLREHAGVDVVDHTDALMPACRGAFEEERGRIYAALESLRDDYDLVVTHSVTDTNQDHHQVAVEATRVFKAHATLLAGEFPSNDLGDFRPQLYVPLTEADVAAKVRMVGAYASQKISGRPYFDESAIRGLCRVRGTQIRSGAAEAFAIGGRVRVVD
jgi:LmbE family N-acetylglucosaminyl deacetylase